MTGEFKQKIVAAAVLGAFATGANALEDPEDDQGLKIPSGAAEDGAADHEQEAEQIEVALPDPAAKPTDCRHEDRAGDDIAREHPLNFIKAHPERGHHFGDGDVQDVSAEVHRDGAKDDGGGEPPSRHRASGGGGFLRSGCRRGDHGV